MRSKIAAGNWKMNLDKTSAATLIEGLSLDGIGDTKVIVAVPSCYLSLALESTSDSRIIVAAQNAHHEQSGAYTGEISFQMLQSMGITHCLIGHSERRQYNGETNDIIKKKIDLCLEHGLTPIFCCGEPLEVRERELHKDYVLTQLKENILHLTTEEVSNIIIAYEPIWAIGTGVTATADQAQEMHAYLRSALANHYDSATASKISILYGGSVKPANAKELFANEDVDGGLVGGASLKADSFNAIMRSF